MCRSQTLTRCQLAGFSLVGLALFGGLCVFAEAVAKKSSVGFITRRMLSQVIQVHKLVMQPHKLAQSPLLSAPVLHE